MWVKANLVKTCGKAWGKPAHQSPPLGPSRFLHLNPVSCLPLRPTCSSALVLGTLSPLGLQSRNLGIPLATPSLWTRSYFMYPLSVSFLSSSFLKLKYSWLIILCSVHFSRLVMSDSFRPHESQHPRPPCPSPTPGVHSNSRPSSRWCHPAISSSVVPFSSCPKSLPASESFPMSQLFAWGGQVLEFQL